MSSHLYPEVSAHLLRATETADWLEWRDWGNPIIAQPFEVVDGHTIVPDRPGNGIEWNEAMAQACEVTRQAGAMRFYQQRAAEAGGDRDH